MVNPAVQYKRFRKWFYAGPKNMGALRIPRFVGYQSVTLTFLYWLHFFINTHLTLIGRIMILVGVLAISYCLLDAYALPMSLIAFSLVGAYLVNITLAFIFKPRMSVNRQIPSRAISGIKVPVNYQLDNQSKLPCFDLKVDAIHYPGCKYEEIIHIPCLSPKESLDLQTEIVFRNRGLYWLPSVFTETSFPFGLCKWGKFGKGTREVRVLPRPVHIQNLSISFLNGENEQNLAVSVEGNGMEFTSCREFRFGDNPKHIHWNSWARTNIPIVREMCDEGQPALSLIFDNCLPISILNKYQDIQYNYELAVSFLAGISEYTQKKQFRVKHFYTDNKVHSFDDMKPDEIHEKIMDISCELQEDRKLTELEISDLALDQINATKGVVLILLNLDQSRLKLIKKLQQAGVSTKIFLLDSEKPSNIHGASFIAFDSLKNYQLGDVG
ncbi:MAG: DUF58 domain-containing protein [Lentisphaeraceae bacterium]|nr:DUF58 domain-containing protein [Lentisphaeraceae bacterium]